MKYVILLLVFFPTFLFAQETAKWPNKMEGTYQIEFLKTAKEPVAVTGEILQKIEANRKEGQISYLIINEQCRIKILPKNALSESNKKKMEEFVIVEKFEN
nr:hypothetical protein [uncultured Flavobacterium sp.]